MVKTSLYDRRKTVFSIRSYNFEVKEVMEIIFIILGMLAIIFKLVIFLLFCCLTRRGRAGGGDDRKYRRDSEDLRMCSEV